MRDAGRPPRPRSGPGPRPSSPSHLFGNVAPVREIKALGLPVARGRRAGRRLDARPDGRAARWATLAAFSFYPSKNLGAFGDGGAIVTGDAVAGRARAHAALPRLARQGHTHDRRLQLPPGRTPGRDPAGPAARISTRWAARSPRRRRARTRQAGLGELLALPSPTPGAQPAWHVFVVATPSAPTSCRPRCGAPGIGARAYYRTPDVPPAGDGSPSSGPRPARHR